MDGTQQTVTVTDRVSDWVGTVNKLFSIELATLKRRWPHEKSFVVDTSRLIRAGPLGLTLMGELERTPDTSLGYIRDAVHQKCLYEANTGRIDPSAIEIRIANYHYVTPIARIRSSHAGTLVAIEGIVRRASTPVAHMTKAVFKCRSCGGFTDPIPQPRRQVEEPEICPRCERKARMDLVQSRSTFLDYQRIQLSESPEGVSQPQSIDVDLFGDVIGTVQPGDRVRITGTIRTQQQTSGVQKSPDFKYYLECSSIMTEEKSYEEVRVDEAEEQVIRGLAARSDVCALVGRSIAPSVCGHEHVKKAIALQLFGGVRKTMRDGTPRRGDVHLLLVGDPGIAKSVLLRYAVRVAPRGIYTSGQGTSRAGLTAAAVKDDFSDGKWMLEAGALVLADTGLAAVDELDKMSDGDRTGLHEAMEQQSVSIAKAGITATLRSRCALLGAANPKGSRFDMFVPIGDQINLPPSLLSRFDLIFVMQDIPNEASDAQLSRHIIRNHRQVEPESGDDENIDPNLLRKWVKLGRDLNPTLTDEAEEAIHLFYLAMRRGGKGANAPLPITARQEEGVIRLSEAAARMRLSETVDASDVRVAVELMNGCLRDVAYDPETGDLDIDRLFSGKSQKERSVERDIIRLIRDLGGRSRVGEITETFIARGHDLDTIQRTLNHLTGSKDLSIVEGTVYLNNP